MPDAKKGKRKFNAQLNSEVAGVRLVRQHWPVHPPAGDANHEAISGSDLAGEIHSPEPEIVSRLIDFIKKI